jgi:hypothetical protein
LHKIEIDGRRYLSEPEPYTGCSASKDEETGNTFPVRNNVIGRAYRYS